jgi:hypothetical protein
MNDQIFEAVVTTVSPAGAPHVAPMGIRYRPGSQVLLMPFRPSTTLDNVLATGCAVLNRVVDGRIYAGCVTGRKAWPMLPVVSGDGFVGQRLACAQSHVTLRLLHDDGHPQRPTLTLQAGDDVLHAPFLGLNRAQSAVLEGAVLVSRLHLLPSDKVRSEMAYLQIAIDKTAGPDEHEAWRWLTDAVARHDAARANPNPTETNSAP